MAAWLVKGLVAGVSGPVEKRAVVTAHRLEDVPFAFGYLHDYPHQRNVHQILSVEYLCDDSVDVFGAAVEAVKDYKSK